MIKKTHLGIYVVIVKEQSILLIKKARGPYTGKLDLPGGKPEHGETIAQTISREALEESGIIIHSTELFNNYSTVVIDSLHPHEEIYHLGMVYKALDYDDTAIIHHMQSEDSLGAQWYLIKTLSEEQVSPFVWQVINDNRIDR